MTLSAKASMALIMAGLMAGPVLSAGAASAASSLPQPVQEALNAALMDEYHAEAFYSAVMDTFGARRPFSNIIGSEQTHADAIIELMQHYGMSVPANTLLGSAAIVAAVPASVGEACAVGVQAEIDNAGLYDGRLLPAVADWPDIAAVFTDLRDASQTKHLPAFQRCAS